MTGAGCEKTWDSARIQRLLVLRMDNFGDVILLTPALRALRRAFPAAHLTLLASPAGAQVAPLLPWIDDVRVARVLWQDASGGLPFDPGRERAFIEDLAAGDDDAALISTSFSQSALPAAYACYLAGIPLRAGFAPDFAGGVLSHPVTPPPPGGHQADRALALLDALGIPPAGTRLELRLPPEIEQSAGALLAGVTGGGPYAVLAPGASCPSRRYGPERFGIVAAELAARTGLSVLVVGSEREAPLVAQVVEAAGADARVVPFAGGTSVPELAAVVHGATLVLTNNSGPMHLAEAFARPSVVLFAGTERESEYAPRAARLRLLRRDTACSPCRTFTCPFSLDCLGISPREVVRAALELLSGSALAERPARLGALSAAPEGA